LFNCKSEKLNNILFSSCAKNYCLSLFSLEAKGLYSHHPAHSCKDIRYSGDSKGDGEYWIDPENNGNPSKVYCDMATDEGKMQRTQKSKKKRNFPKMFVYHIRPQILQPRGPFSKVPVNTGPANLPGRLTGNLTGPGIAFLEALVNFPGTYWARKNSGLLLACL